MEPNKPTDPSQAPTELTTPPGIASPPTAGEAAAALVIGGPEVDPLAPTVATEPLAGPAVESPPTTEPPSADQPTTTELPASVDSAEPSMPPTPTLSPEDRERLRATVEQAREKFLAAFRANPRSKSPEVTAIATEYMQALPEEPDLLTAEWQRLRIALAESPTDGHVGECELVRANVDRLCATYAALFNGLGTVEQAVATEVARMKEDDPNLLAAPAEIRELFGNYKKGLEIIQRMFSRLHARRKPLDTIPPLALAPTLAEEVPPQEEWPNRLTEFGNALSSWRVTGATALRDCQKKAESVRKEVVGFVSALLGPLDGIEAGSRNELDLRDRLEPFRADHGPFIDGWVGAYGRLESTLETFFKATGLAPVTVEPRTPFQPETMEPGGTVLLPDRPIEEVVSVMRRGYALNGEQVRPVQVEVVVHTQSDSSE